MAATRMTIQRKVILDELCKVTSHPTADEIYAMVRKRLPRVSLGTVYRNLDVLAEHGAILKLEHAGSQMRFDGNVHPHYHVRCMECGRVADVKANVELPEIEDARAEGFHIMGATLEFHGVCEQCRARVQN